MLSILDRGRSSAAVGGSGAGACEHVAEYFAYFAAAGSAVRSSRREGGRLDELVEA